MVSVFPNRAKRIQRPLFFSTTVGEGGQVMSRKILSIILIIALLLELIAP